MRFVGTPMETSMGGELRLRDLDDDLLARLAERAARHGRTVEAEHREILHRALAGEADRSFEARAARLRSETSGRPHTPSEILLRESRDER